MIYFLLKISEKINKGITNTKNLFVNNIIKYNFNFYFLFLFFIIIVINIIITIMFGEE